MRGYTLFLTLLISLVFYSKDIHSQHLIHYYDSTKSMDHDSGRFTLGADNNRLMYGFPIPMSTSHFNVWIGDEVASNSGISKNILAGLPSTQGKRFIYSFKFKNIEIKQILTPVDAQLKYTTEDASVKYYLITYKITNKGPIVQEVGLMCLLDFMINRNDECDVKAHNQRVRRETAYYDLHSNVPKEIFIFEKHPIRRNQMIAQCLFDEGLATKPSEIYVGNWPYLYEIQKFPRVEDMTIEDCAAWFKWNATKILPNREIEFSYYFGVKSNQKMGVSVLFETNLNAKKIRIPFVAHKFELSSSTKKKINDFLDSFADRKVYGIVLDTYSDNTVNSKTALKLSTKRMNTILRFLKKRDNNYNILPKSRGQSPLKNEKNAVQRSAELVVYYE